MRKRVDSARWVAILGGMHRVVPGHNWRREMKITISRPAYLFADADDSLAAAEAAVAVERRIELWEVTARWEDDEREMILLDVPPLKLIGDEVYDIDAMPMFGGRGPAL